MPCGVSSREGGEGSNSPVAGEGSGENLSPDWGLGRWIKASSLIRHPPTVVPQRNKSDAYGAADRRKTRSDGRLPGVASSAPSPACRGGLGWGRSWPESQKPPPPNLPLQAGEEHSTGRLGCEPQRSCAKALGFAGAHPTLRRAIEKPNQTGRVQLCSRPCLQGRAWVGSLFAQIPKRPLKPKA